MLRSRKFVVCLVTMVFVTGGYLACVQWAALAGLFPAFVGGILGAASIYGASNVPQKWIEGKGGSEPVP